MNIFDAIGKTTFDVMRVTFGYAATWVRSEDEVNANVLYKAPTHKFDMNENDFMLERHTMEYYETDFPSLYDSVSDAGNERIKIEVAKGVFENFIVKRCEKKGDGKTVIAFLTPINL